MIQDSSFVPTIGKVYENSMLNILRGDCVNIKETGCRLFNAVWKGYDTGIRHDERTLRYALSPSYKWNRLFIIQ